MASGDPAEVEKAKTALRSAAIGYAPGDPRPGHRDRPEVPGRRMRLPRAPGLGRPRRGPGRGRAAVLAGAVVLAVLAVAAARRAPGAGRRAGPPGGSRPGDPHRLAADTVPAAPAASRPRRRRPRRCRCRGAAAAGCWTSAATSATRSRAGSRAGQVRGQPAAGPDRADRPVDPAAGLHPGGADPVVDRARDRRRLLRAAGAHRRDHRDEPRDPADLLLGQGDRPPDRARLHRREPVDGPDDPRGRPRQRPVRRVHRRRRGPADRRDLADDHAGQLDQLTAGSS